MSDIQLMHQTGGGAAQTMSSREIAELTGKEHRNVMRDARAMLVELYGEGGVLSFEHTQVNPQNGQPYPVLNLPKRETLVLIAGYSIPLRAKIIDRWQELETAASAPAIPQTMPEALRLAAQALEDAQTARAAQVKAEVMLQLEAKRSGQLEAQVAETAPKAAALDRIAAGDEALTMTQAAKMLGIKRDSLTKWMHANGWIYRQNGSWVAYDQHIKNGRLQFKEAKYTDEKTGLDCHKPYCHILPKGFTRLAEVFSKEAIT